VVRADDKQDCAQDGTAGKSAYAVPSAQSVLEALALIARLHQVAADPNTLLHRLGKSEHDRLGVTDMLLSAQALGLKAHLDRR